MNDSDLLDLWVEHGMPSNDSTREGAVAMLQRYRAKNVVLSEMVDQLCSLFDPPDPNSATPNPLRAVATPEVDHATSGPSAAVPRTVTAGPTDALVPSGALFGSRSGPATGSG